MNKDVIYIEPEHDITDILANIKGAKSKIVALVPPKKTSVLRSAVNFKLISKAATKAEKTVVLITSDESLLRLASSVKMPTAKNLQSKPQLPDTGDAVEFGEEKEDIPEDGTIDDNPDEAEEAPVEEEPKKAAKAKADKKDDAVAAAAAAEEVEDLGKLDDDEKKPAKKKKAVVPNFKKYRKYIIGGAFIIILLVLLLVWANVVAPAAKISVKVHTTASNFSKVVKLVTDSSKSDPENGVFFIEEKTLTKKAEAEFEARGQKEVGNKATGKVYIKRTSPVASSSSIEIKIPAIDIPAGTRLTSASGLVYETTEKASLGAVGNDNCEPAIVNGRFGCKIRKAIDAVVSVRAVDIGPDYNLAEGVSLKTSDSKYAASVHTGGITGGSKKTIKVISEDNLKEAENNLENSDADARSELASEFSGDYILIGSSFKAKERKISTSPLQGEEVGEGVTPKIFSEVTYSIFAVQRTDIDIYIRAQVSENIGDNTQEIYSSGIVAEGEEGADKAFFDNYKEENGNITAKLKSTVKTGPRVTPEMIAEKSYGEKVGKVKSLLTSINGISSVDIETSYFWVTSIPSDPNKVDITITVE